MSREPGFAPQEPAGALTLPGEVQHLWTRFSRSQPGICETSKEKRQQAMWQGESTPSCEDSQAEGRKGRQWGYVELGGEAGAQSGTSPLRLG